MFNDSVQDAAHRAGFVANRSYTFSLRALLTKHLTRRAAQARSTTSSPTWSRPRRTGGRSPPWSRRTCTTTRASTRLLSGQGRGGGMQTWQLIGERLAFETLMEFGFRSRNGRTLELTRTAAAQVAHHRPGSRRRAGHARPMRSAPETGCRCVPEQDDARYLAFLRIFLERLRTRGAVGHRWLDKYLDEAGTSRYFIWGGRAPRHAGVPQGRSRPGVPAGPAQEGQRVRLRHRPAVLVRAMGAALPEPDPRAGRRSSGPRLLPELAGAGTARRTHPERQLLRVYGLQPGSIEACAAGRRSRCNDAYVRCPVCFWEQTVHPSLLDQWHGQPCPSYRCRRGRLVAGDRPREARRAPPRPRLHATTTTAGCTARPAPTRWSPPSTPACSPARKRERVEAAFRNGARASTTPTCCPARPRWRWASTSATCRPWCWRRCRARPANYAQQVGRAGRRTGNAFLLTIPDRSRRDLYFLERPRDMIAGQDRAAGLLPLGRRDPAPPVPGPPARPRRAPAGCVRADGSPLAALPRKAPPLFGPSGYLADLVEAALAQGEKLVDGLPRPVPDRRQRSGRARS